MWGVLCNPKSGGGYGAKLKRELLAELDARKVSYLDISAESYREAEANLKNSINSIDSGLFVIGGDGMVNLAVQQLANTKIPLALIPGGTGNDFARTLNLDLISPVSNIDLYLNVPPTEVDLGNANNRFFAQILSTGFDSLVNERANKIHIIKGKSKYNLAILLELSKFLPKHYEFKVDEVSFGTEAMLVAVSNGKSYGGGMLITPMADNSDGFFDVMILGPVSKLEFIKVFPKVFSGSHVNHPAVKFMRAKTVQIHAHAVAYADGERISELPVTAKIAPKALRVWSR